MLNTIEQNLYCIDRDDFIVSVGPGWDQFALSNGAPELEGLHVVGRSLWDFVSDALTRHVYQQVLAEVRKSRSISFDFRCDSPDRRRFLEMRMTPLSNDGVQFETFTTSIEDRSSQDLFRRSTECIDKLVITCSWCKKVQTADNVWHEVEQAVQILQLFDLDSPPRLSHGMCQGCFEGMIAKLNTSRNQS